MVFKEVSLGKIRRAAKRTRQFYSHTSLQRVPWLERKLGVDFEIYLKREDLQPTGAFKCRGAAALISSIIQREGRDGVQRFYARSSGNHGLGCAYVCQKLSIPLTVVLPKTVPQPKLKGIRDLFGANVLMFDLNDTRSDGYTPGDDELASLKGDGAFFLHPYAEPATMLGTANIGLEICDDLPDVTDVIGEVSGGGLFGGTCAGVKQRLPDVNMIAVEPSGANDFQQSLEAGSIVRLPRPTGIADGLLSHDVGPMNWEVLRQCVSPENAVTVTDEEIWYAMKILWEICGIITEPSGAAAFAALLAMKIKLRGKKAVFLISGGNVDRSVFEASLNAGHWTGAAH